MVWTALFAVALGVLVFLLVLIGIGDLRLPGSSSPSVTVTEVKWTIEQGTNKGGLGWFGKGEFNYTNATGWMAPTYPAGSRFTVSWSIANYDTVNHTIYSVSLGSPFLLAGTRLPLPMNVNVGDDGNVLELYVTTPSSTSGAFALNITVNALGAA